MSSILKMRSRERGFTLIELLTVIIIIGVLAAIAIPVFSAQRSRAQDTQTVSDVRNIVTAAETYLADRTKSVSDLSQSSVEYASSNNVLWDIKGNATTGGYCIAAFNASGKDYKTTSTLLTYDSTAGGLKKVGGSCGTTTGGATGANGSVTPTPTSSTGVGSLVATPAFTTQTWNTNSSGSNGTIQTFAVPATGTYQIQAWGARGGGIPNNSRTGGYGAYTSGVYTLNAGQTVSLLIGQSAANGTSGGAGGGGGTFVTFGTNSAATALTVASGGGGATTGQNGNPGSSTSSTSTGGGSGGGGGGGGFTGSGNSASASGGSAFTVGGAGGSQGNGGTDGGYGGGGGGVGGCGGACAGGGGGYGGGYSGNGGGSYVASTINGTAVTSVTSVGGNTDTNTSTYSDGRVVITKIS